MIPLTTDNRMLGFASLAADPNISHFVTTRLGGVSSGSYASFNCSPFTADRTENIQLNMDRLLSGLPATPRWMVIPRQVHGVRILEVDDALLALEGKALRSVLDGVDALITRVPNCCIAVSTADCVPVLLYDPCAKVIAVAHAGWRGTVARIAAQVAGRMSGVYGTDLSNLRVFLGPSISAGAFEVGQEVYDAFRDAGFEMDSIAFVDPASGKWHIDLWKANIAQLTAVGVPAAQIECASVCTYSHPDLFFSARRLGIDSGRILSGIMLNN